MTEQEALEAMVAREPIFHRAEFGTGREDFAHMTAEDYWEVGASGKVYRRDFCWTCWWLGRESRSRHGRLRVLSAGGSGSIAGCLPMLWCKTGYGGRGGLPFGSLWRGIGGLFITRGRLLKTSGW